VGGPLRFSGVGRTTIWNEYRPAALNCPRIARNFQSPFLTC
jgi:hypothetical protein